MPEITDLNQTPTDRELEILKILWKKGSATVREVWKELSESDAREDPEKDLAYTTVLTMLQVMRKKGHVVQKTEEKAHLFSAAQPKKRTVANLSRRFLDKVFDGARDEYLVHILKPQEVSFEELDRLEQMIEQVRREKSNDNPKHV